MKRFISLALALVLVVCCFGLVSCGGDDVEGTYELYSYNGEEWDAEEMGGATMTIELKSGGKAIFSESNGSDTYDEEGTWEQDGSTISITVSGETIDFELSGNKLSGKMGSIEAVFKK